MRFMLRGLPFAALLLLSGCLRYSPYVPIRSQSVPGADAYVRADLDELLRFGAHLAQQSGAARAQECQMLIRRRKETPGIGIDLHLMMGRVFSDTCGDIPKILAAVAAIAPASLPDQRVRWLVTVQTETLTRLGTPPRKAASVASVQRKKKAVSKAPEPVKKETTPTDQARIEREKLEAIRSIERSMDEAGEGKPQ